MATKNQDGKKPGQEKSVVPEQDKTTAAKMKSRAKELDHDIRGRREQVRRGPLEDGLDAAEMKAGNLWIYLGFEDETAYRKSVNIGRSTWFRYRRLAEGLSKLAKSEFLKLIAENADHLIKLPEDRRYNKDLIKKAQTLTEEDFEKYIIKFQAKADKVDEGEVIVSVKWRMPESRRAVILDNLKWFARQNDLDPDDESRVLELMSVECRQRNPVVTNIMRATALLRDADDLLNGKGKAANLSADEIMEKVHIVIGAVVKGMAAAAGVKVEQMAVPKAAAATTGAVQ